LPVGFFDETLEHRAVARCGRRDARTAFTTAMEVDLEKIIAKARKAATKQQQQRPALPSFASLR